jgi:hypothetical protein
MDNSTVGACCLQALLRIFSEVTYDYVHTVYKDSRKFYYVKNLYIANRTITIRVGVCFLETQLSSLLYGCGASNGRKWSMPWMSANA